MARMDEFLHAMVEAGGSDLHLSVSLPPKVRISGEITALDSPPLTTEDMEQILSEVCPKDQWEHFLEAKDLDFAYEIEGLARFRVNYLCNYFGNAAVLRTIPAKVLSLEQLNLPEAIRKVCHYNEGLVFVTGPTGSGKSTTMAAMLDYINATMAKHIITIEDPVEFVHQNKKSVIVHREVGLHAKSFGRALESAMRADPDIILVGEMRELETIRLSLTCASMGMLVFGTLHTNNAPKTIDRVIDVFPAAEKSMVRSMLSESLQAVVSQTLLKRSTGGRVAAHEIMRGTSAIRNLIREDKVAQMYSAIQTGSALGMQTMDQCLEDLVAKRTITREVAREKARMPENF